MTDGWEDSLIEAQMKSPLGRFVLENPDTWVEVRNFYMGQGAEQEREKITKIIDGMVLGDYSERDTTLMEIASTLNGEVLETANDSSSFLEDDPE